MDTLEIAHGPSPGSPILWIGKTPKEVLRAKYPRGFFCQEIKAPRSLCSGVEYCDKYYVAEKGVEPGGGEVLRLRATFIAIPGG